LSEVEHLGDKTESTGPERGCNTFVMFFIWFYIAVANDLNYTTNLLTYFKYPQSDK